MWDADIAPSSTRMLSVDHARDRRPDFFGIGGRGIGTQRIIDRCIAGPAGLPFLKPSSSGEHALGALSRHAFPTGTADRRGCDAL